MIYGVSLNISLNIISLNIVAFTLDLCSLHFYIYSTTFFKNLKLLEETYYVLQASINIGIFETLYLKIKSAICKFFHHGKKRKN